MIRFLLKEIVMTIHDDQIRLYGGVYGVRDDEGLDAAVHMPHAQFDGQYFHSSIFQMAAAYGFHLCQNHPFLDGNKRTTGMVMFTFLQLNEQEPIATEPDYYAKMMAVATGNLSKEELADWLRTAVNGTPPDIYGE
jgi:death-on-curing protein